MLVIVSEYCQHLLNFNYLHFVYSVIYYISFETIFKKDVFKFNDIKSVSGTVSVFSFISNFYFKVFFPLFHDILPITNLLIQIINFTICIILHTQTVYLRISTLINYNTLSPYHYTIVDNIPVSTITILSIFIK